MKRKWKFLLTALVILVVILVVGYFYVLPRLKYLIISLPLPMELKIPIYFLIPEPPPEPIKESLKGKIIFVNGSPQEGYFIWMMDRNGSNVKKLVQGSNAAISPDGKKIAFTREGIDFLKKKSYCHIYLLDLPTGEVTQLTHFSIFERSPLWSPDGRKIAFIATNESANPEEYICVINIDGSGYTRIEKGFEPSWSPDGGKLLFSLNRSIYVANADGSNLVIVAKGIWPSWSLDGRKIIFGTESREIFVVNADGSNLTKIGTGWHPVPSPDTKKILFECYCGNLSVINIDGSNLICSTLTGYLCNHYFWSPDGKRVYAIKTIVVNGTFSGEELYIMDANLTVTAKITLKNGRINKWEWSPDGREILFEIEYLDQYYQSNWYIYVMNADGKNFRQLGRGGGAKWVP